MPALPPPGFRAPSRRSGAHRGGDGRHGGRWIYGRHAVAAALANPARSWRELLVLAGHEREAEALLAGAVAARARDGTGIRILSRREFSSILGEDAVHQGLALLVEPLIELSLEETLSAGEATAGREVVLVLDRVQDPQNVGAVLRSAAAFGALAVVLPAHGAPSSEGALAKAASGALERLPLVRATNLARALDRLKEGGFWVCGLDESAPDLFSAKDLGLRVALVLGAEGEGMRRLVRERCDFLARLPTREGFPTLNVSNAAAVALYELLRRCGGGKRG